MSFWNGLKSAFGFSQDGEDDEEEYDASLPTYAVDKSDAPQPETIPESVSPRQDAETRAEADTSLPGDLFDSLIQTFNSAQPDFISKCLSIQAQRTYLLESLSDSLRARLSAAVANGAGTSGWEEERIKLERRITSLEAENRTVDSLRHDNRKLQLSIDRQKRALLDRINDLEAQVAQMHAEKEKFFTDKRNPADAARLDEASKRISELEETNEHLAAQISGMEQHARDLEESMRTLQSDTVSSSEVTEDPRIKELEEELHRQSTLREQLEVKTRMSDEIINDLRNSLAASRNELERVNAEQEEAMAQIHEELSGFEDLKRRLDARIAELQEALKAERREEREARIAKLTEENASLRHTVENNLYNQANSEMRMRSEIKNLKARLEEALGAASSAPPQTTGPVPAAISATPSTEPSDETQKPPQRRRGRPKKIRIDEDLDNTEWFAAGGKKEDPDFGYHEPPRRPSNDNAAQLSLF